MSVVSGPAARARRGGVRAQLEVSWHVVCRGAAGVAACDPLGRFSGECVLRWVIDGGEATCALSAGEAKLVLVGDGGVLHEGAGKAARLQDGDGLEHVRVVGAGGEVLLAVTARRSRKSEVGSGNGSTDEEVLYARTSVFEKLGVAGGRYEVANGQWGVASGGDERQRMVSRP